MESKLIHIFGFRVSTFCGLLIKKKKISAYPRVTDTFFHVISYERYHLASHMQATWLSSGACHTIQTCFAPVDASGFFVQWLFLSLSTPWGFLTPAPLVLRLAVSPLGQWGEEQTYPSRNLTWSTGLRPTWGVAALQR